MDLHRQIGRLPLRLAGILSLVIGEGSGDNGNQQTGEKAGMAYRYGWLAGAIAVTYALCQLNGLLQGTVEGVPWQLEVASALLLGVGITWFALVYRLPTWLAIGANAVAALAAATWVAAPGTARSLFPHKATWTALQREVPRALELLRTGVDRAIPYPGLVAMLVILFWAVGFLLAWGLFRGRPYIALLPPLVITLQFATIDQDRTSLLGSAAFLSIVAMCLVAVSLDRRSRGTGQMFAAGELISAPTRLSWISMGLVASAVAASIGVVGLLGALVPAKGVLECCSLGGPGGEPGKPGTYNPFIGIHQRLVTNSDTAVFAARIEGDVPVDQIYFTLMTMESYDGDRFAPAAPAGVRLEGERWLDPGHEFAGPVGTVVADIEIRALAMGWLPGVTTPVGFDTGDRTLRSAIRVSPDDGSLRIEGGRTVTGMEYRVISEMPLPDPGALAWVGASPSPVFEQARNAGEAIPEAVAVPVRFDPPDVARYVGLPDHLDRRIRALAVQQTRNLTTPFEKAIALETWFRNEFGYTTGIMPGHSATNLASWLLEPNSPNYREGYCENFATSMAVLARTLGIPSRVVLGFAPGTQQSDGTIVVRDQNAHAWVELWMPTQGWVRFDPTPRGDRINPSTLEAIEVSLGFAVGDYLEVPDPAGGERTIVSPPSSTVPRTTLPPKRAGDAAGGSGIAGLIPGLVLWATASLLVLGGVPALKWLRRRRRLRRLCLGDISAAWEEIVLRLDDLGTPPSPADTPAEVASKVGPVMAPLAVVYTRSVYGETSTVPADLVIAATTSLARTEQRLAQCHTRARRLVASYRIRTLLPRWWVRFLG